MPTSPFKNLQRNVGVDVSQDAASMEVEANGRKSALRNGPYTAPPSKVARTLDSELEIAADAVPETQGGSGTGVGGSGAEGSGGKKSFLLFRPFKGQVLMLVLLVLVVWG